MLYDLCRLPKNGKWDKPDPRESHAWAVRAGSPWSPLRGTPFYPLQNPLHKPLSGVLTVASLQLQPPAAARKYLNYFIA